MCLLLDELKLNLPQVLRIFSPKSRFGLSSKDRIDLLNKILALRWDLKYDVFTVLAKEVEAFCESKGIQDAKQVGKEISSNLKKRIVSGTTNKQKKLNLLEKLIQRDGLDCIHCRKKIHPLFLSLEHLIPSCMGGKTKLNNLALACINCNNARADFMTYETIEKWKELNGIGEENMKSIVCPRCDAKHDDPDDYSFDEKLNVTCGSCGKLMFSTTVEGDAELHRETLKYHSTTNTNTHISHDYCNEYGGYPYHGPAHRSGAYHESQVGAGFPKGHRCGMDDFPD